ncbi:MAG: HAMP domain-containing histidine kinase [Oscillospiraceae bacterium]|nr:HAMP domain-containing histidine kinase [Oscillospiraceae bacterium]
MNSYPIIVSENLVFRSKETTMKSSVSVMATALTGLAELNEENVATAMTVAEESGVSRILVTDDAGRVLYDSRETDSAQGRYAFYTEIVQALHGNDAFSVAYADDAFQSRCSSPVIYRSQTIGAVYAYEYDTEQAALLRNLQSTLLRISGGVLIFVVLISILLSRVLTRRFGVLAGTIRRMREGDYGGRANVGGHDEIADIAAEFNSLADRLQSTEEVRRRFVADASHELKTPLAGIRLLADSILQTETMDGDTLREFVGDIGLESERLSRITEDLLRLTRLDSGAVEGAERVAVAPAVARAVHMLRLVAQERGVALSAHVEREGTVLATADEMHQIVYNLTENGIKYNHSGGFVRVTLSGDDRTVVLAVEDNGIGIPDGDLPRIFDRFYRVDKMRSRAYGGTGLGLSIVSDTVRRRGGTVEAAQREGGGSVFTVRLPRAAEEGGAQT